MRSSGDCRHSRRAERSASGLPIFEESGARASLLGEWLDATRVRRVKDEAAEIARLGRFPTLYAWELLKL